MKISLLYGLWGILTAVVYSGTAGADAGKPQLKVSASQSNSTSVLYPGKPVPVTSSHGSPATADLAMYVHLHETRGLVSQFQGAAGVNACARY